MEKPVENLWKTRWEAGFPQFASQLLHIIPKKGGAPSPFILNPAQQVVDNAFEEALKERRPVRLIILKARQEGVSTWSLGRMYFYATTNRGVTTFLVAHDDDSTRELFHKVRIMYEWQPDPRPMTRYSSRTELDFSKPDRGTGSTSEGRGLQSKIRLGTAGKTTIGRSKTLRYLHLSEVAFWQNASTVLLSLEQALPDDPDTVEIIESTANGVGGEFYKRWKVAENKQTRGDWRAVFLPWHTFPEYQRPGVLSPIPGECEPNGFEREEADLIKTFGLSNEQVNWRRWAIVNKCGGSLERFRQEYPSSPQEAFLVSGKPVFSRERVMYRINELEAEDLRRRADKRPARFFTGDLVERRVDGGGNEMRFLPDPEGPLKVYKLPQAHHKYILGGDPVRGGLIGDDTDFAEWHVFDRLTWEQCAVYRARIEATEFARMGWRIGFFYLGALLVPEANDHGHTVCVKLQEWNYPDIYMRQDFDDYGSIPIERPGWETNRKTRGIMIDAIEAAVREKTAKFNDLETLYQMLTFVRNPKNGKRAAAPDCHDDGVMASALALVVLDHGPGIPSDRDILSLEPLRPDQAMVARKISAARAEVQSAQAAAWMPRDPW